MKIFYPLLLGTMISISAMAQAKIIPKSPQKQLLFDKPVGWSLDIGGTYTWDSFTTPPTYSGSTGGVQGKITYQTPSAFFGQARSFYNLGPLTNSLNNTNYYEWYSEFIGGYCLSLLENWTLTPYAGVGLDFLRDHHASYSSVPSIDLHYSIYYALAGLDTHYTWQDWMLGLQIESFPTFNQYLKIETLSEAAWTLTNKVGVAIRLPTAYRYVKNFWLEATPYYRLLPIGASGVLGLPDRHLYQWGAFFTFRFFL